MDCTHLFSNASVIRVCLQREISRPNSLEIPGGESKKYLAMTYDFWASRGSTGGLGTGLGPSHRCLWTWGCILPLCTVVDGL